jgi:hypothetical protein
MIHVVVIVMVDVDVDDAAVGATFTALGYTLDRGIFVAFVPRPTDPQPILTLVSFRVAFECCVCLHVSVLYICCRRLDGRVCAI